MVPSPDSLGVHFFPVGCRVKNDSRRRTPGVRRSGARLLPITAPWGCHQYARQFLTMFFFFFLARSKWIYYLSAARHRANGSVSRGWLGFHACVGVWLYFRTNFHWCWHTRQSSETCLSNCNMLCRKIRLLMLRRRGRWQFRMAP